MGTCVSSFSLLSLNEVRLFKLHQFPQGMAKVQKHSTAAGMDLREAEAEQIQLGLGAGCSKG